MIPSTGIMLSQAIGVTGTKAQHDTSRPITQENPMHYNTKLTIRIQEDYTHAPKQQVDKTQGDITQN
jgi:hypothetical protein